MRKAELKRSSPLRSGSGLNRKPMKRSGFTPASKEQREKVKGLPCMRCGADGAGMVTGPIDPAHVCARAHGGCDDALCVVPLCRRCHREFDQGQLDLLPHLVFWCVPEIQHALGHYNGDLIALLQRLTGVRYVPESEAA